MTEYTIEKNVPLPERAHGARRRYPFAAMDVGDSFEETCSADEAARVLTRLRSAAHMYRRRADGDMARRFACRQTETGVRVWRLA